MDMPIVDEIDSLTARTEYSLNVWLQMKIGENAPFIPREMKSPGDERGHIYTIELFTYKFPLYFPFDTNR